MKKKYFIQIIIILLVAALAGCGSGFTGDVLDMAGRTIVFPEVSSSSVAEGTAGISIRPNIVITFSQEMDVNSVEQNLRFERGGYGAVNVVTSWFDNDRTLSISVDSDLELNNIYVLGIDAGAMSKAGYSMQGDFSTYFTTSHVDNVPPIVIGTNPVDGAVNVPGGQNIVVYFSKDMNKSTAEAAFSLQDSDGQDVSGTFSWAGCNMIFTPAAKLTPFGRYTITISTDAEDYMGNNSISSFVVEFVVYLSHTYIFKNLIGDNSKYFISNPWCLAYYQNGSNQYVFISDKNNHRIVKYKINENSAVYVTHWGTNGSGDGEFNFPYGIAIDKNTNVYVIDSNRVQKFDFYGKFISKFGSEGDGNYQFRSPMGIVCDSLCNIYVLQYSNAMVKKYDSNFNFIKKWGEGTFNSPYAITIDIFDNIYIADTWNHRIVKYDTNGNQLLSWGGSRGSDTYQFDAPSGVAADDKSYVYVADTYNDRIKKYTGDGVFITSFGVEGDGQFNYPYGIVADNNGYLYVADSGNDQIQKLTDSISFVYKFGFSNPNNAGFKYPQSVFVDTSGNIYVVDQNSTKKFLKTGELVQTGWSSGTGIVVDSTDNVYISDISNHIINKYDKNGNLIKKWGSWGTGASQFREPYDIVLDSSNNVYITDSYNNRIQKFDSDGNFLKMWGGTGSGDGQFNYCQGIAIDTNDNIYVSDTYNHRIQKFDSNGKFLMKWGNQGSTNGQLNRPKGIKVDKYGFVFVVDQVNCRIQKFDSSGNFVTSWGQRGSELGEFSNNIFWIRGLALDEQGCVYVADCGNNRIQVFTPVSE